MSRYLPVQLLAVEHDLPGREYSVVGVLSDCEGSHSVAVVLHHCQTEQEPL